MASIQERGGRWQVRVVHKLLPKPFFSTFSDEAEARQYAAQLESLLERGIIPAGLDGPKRSENPQLSKIITAYLADSNIAASDRTTLRLVSRVQGHTRLLDVSAAWADLWVSRMKVTDHLAPSTIRKRVESLARVIDWHFRRKGDAVVNPLRSMPRGYASATAAEVKQLKLAGKVARRDVARDRQLDAAEVAAVRQALAGVKSDKRERPLPKDAAFALMFEILLATGMRLREVYRLRVDQIDFVRWVIRVEGSKGHRGVIKPRVVPMLKSLRKPLQAWCRGRVGLMLPFWDGTPEDLPRCTSRLSNRFATLLDYAGVTDATEHDLRHTATCGWFQLREDSGRWMFSEIEVCRIMGWADPRMALRYASIRGEDLSARLG